jgi:hypothetical protein
MKHNRFNMMTLIGCVGQSLAFQWWNMHFVFAARTAVSLRPGNVDKMPP